MKYAASKIPKKWLKIILGIPGYDPRDQAEDCYFDAAAAQTPIDFFAECLTHVKAEWAGDPFVLAVWQTAIVANVYGWQRPDGTRRYREVFIYVARKNGKTAFAAGNVLFMLFCEHEAGAEIYSSAADKDQASLLYDQATEMVRNEEVLQSRSTIYLSTRAIVLKDHTGSYKPISADAYSKHGYGASFVVNDELHAQPNAKLIEVLETSMGSRRQPLTFHITTADFARPSICNTKLKEARAVRDNGGKRTKPGYDPEFLPVIYEASRKDDWTKVATWRKANPNLGISVKMVYMRRKCRKAMEDPTFENTFKRLHLNIVTEQAERWIQMDKWDASAGAVDAKELEGRECYAGMDLAETIDTASTVLFFPDPDPEAEKPRHKVLPFFWIPEERARERELRDHVPFLAWAAQGLIELTPGNIIDYRYIRRRLVELSKLYQIIEVGYDPWNARQLALQLKDEEELPMVEFRQGYQSMNEPCKRLGGMILAAEIEHGAHPVLDWQAANISIRKDPAGNIKIDKPSSTEKVDGMVGLVMGIGCWMAQQGAGKSVYEERGAIFL